MMNKLPISLIGLLTAGTMLAACQSDVYRIKGEAPMLTDGDTLFITDDLRTGKPIDTLIVKDGKFESADGIADSTCFCMIYSKSRSNVYAPFFIEPGTISIRLSDNKDETRVKGTSTNNKWQEMNDSIAGIGRQMKSIAEYMTENELNYNQQQREMKKIDALQKLFRKLVNDYAKKNTDNEFGYFLITAYDDLTSTDEADRMIDTDTRLELIKKLPHRMLERQALKQLTEQLNQMKSTAEGNTMPDFTMDDINGNPVHALVETGKNKVTVIDFWASWCGPCRAEMPNMIRLYDEYKDKGLGILGVSLDAKRSDWEAASKSLGVKWTQVSDVQGWRNTAAELFSVRAIPYTVVVDSKGKILKKGLRGEALEDYVKSLLE